MSKPFKLGTVLLVTSQVTQRSGLRKTMGDLGLDNKLIEVAGDFDQARERLSRSPAVNILITDEEIGTHRGIEFLDLHKKNNPSTQERIFVLMASESSPFLLAEFSLKGGDVVVSKPFTNDTFMTTLTQAIQGKEKLSAEALLSFEIQDAISIGDFDKAEGLSRTFKDPESFQALFTSAQLFEAKGDKEGAFESYARAAKASVDFRTLVGVVRTGTQLQKHFELLSYVEQWLKSFPLHHASLQDISRIIIANRKFELLDEIFDVFAKYQINDSFARLPLAAGFVMASAHHFESGNMGKTKDYAMKALEYSSKKMPIVMKALEMIMKSGDREAAERAYMRLELQVLTIEEKVMDLRVQGIIYPKEQILSNCMKLLAQKVVDPELFRLAIACYRHIGKDPQEIIVQARRLCPGQAFD